MSTTTKATIYGTINKDGVILSGSGFSVTKHQTGQFIIDFEQEFKDIPAIVGSQTGWGKLSENTLDNVVFPFLSNGSATALTGDSSGDPSSRQFSFIAMGEVDDE